MERNLVFNMVQGQIGYKFRNPDLLQQAFTRRSYSEENGGENNEVLEFIGDKSLDLSVIRFLTQRFGRVSNKTSANTSGEFLCDYDEGELTKIKSRMVDKKNLARRMDEMGFAEHLILGNSDIKNHVNDVPSVKEDLFEAIVGAVTIDCNWNFDTITSVVEAMLVPEDFLSKDSDNNYVRLIQEWEENENHVVPWFWFKEQSYTSTFYFNFPGISQHIPLDYDTNSLKYHCELKLLDSLPIFRGFGASKSEARMNVCKLAYDYLCKNDYIREKTIRDEIDNPNREDAINQLEILARRGYFSIPIYNFSESYDNNGNPIWKAVCRIAEYDHTVSANSSVKKDAKKSAAFGMLKYILEDN